MKKVGARYDVTFSPYFLAHLGPSDHHRRRYAPQETPFYPVAVSGRALVPDARRFWTIRSEIHDWD